MAKNKTVEHNCSKCGRLNIFSSQWLGWFDWEYTCRGCGTVNKVKEVPAKKRKKEKQEEKTKGRMKGPARSRTKKGRLRKKRSDTNKPRKKRKE